MSELSNWVWLIVALIWVLTRILPGLLRKQSARGSGPTPARRPTAAAPASVPNPIGSEPEPQRFSRHRASAKPPESLGSTRPIEPR